MAKKDEVVQENTPELQPHIEYHLDRDLNDPRNAEPTPQLPSLDDESQQTPKDYKGVTG